MSDASNVSVNKREVASWYKSRVDSCRKNVTGELKSARKLLAELTTPKSTEAGVHTNADRLTNYMTQLTSSRDVLERELDKLRTLRVNAEYTRARDNDFDGVGKAMSRRIRLVVRFIDYLHKQVATSDALKMARQLLTRRDSTCKAVDNALKSTGEFSRAFATHLNSKAFWRACEQDLVPYERKHMVGGSESARRVRHAELVRKWTGAAQAESVGSFVVPDDAPLIGYEPQEDASNNCLIDDDPDAASDELDPNVEYDDDEDESESDSASDSSSDDAAVSEGTAIFEHTIAEQNKEFLPSSAETERTASGRSLRRNKSRELMRKYGAHAIHAQAGEREHARKRKRPATEDDEEDDDDDPEGSVACESSTDDYDEQLEAHRAKVLAERASV